jgi:hypothetical protein
MDVAMSARVNVSKANPMEWAAPLMTEMIFDVVRSLGLK